MQITTSLRPRAFFLALAFVAAGSASASDSEATSAEIDDVVNAALQHPAAVGLSVAVGLGDDVVLAKGYGMAELEHGVPVDADTMFRIGSITKQFTAAAIMRLQERDELGIDEDMTLYLTDYPTHGNFVSMRHLLTHTSGIPSYTGLGAVFWHDACVDLDHEGMLARFKDLPFDFAPGAEYRYNNSGFYLLGVILEQVTGKPYGQVMQDELFSPLGLTRMSAGSNTRLIPGRAQGYQSGENGELMNDDLIAMGRPGGAGNLLASAGDLVRWKIALVSDRVVSPESFAQMTMPHRLNGGSETEYGFGLSVADELGRSAISHGGGIQGFNSFLVHFRAEDVTVAVISNSEGFSSRDVAVEVAKVALEGLAAPVEAGAEAAADR